MGCIFANGRIFMIERDKIPKTPDIIYKEQTLSVDWNFHWKASLGVYFNGKAQNVYILDGYRYHIFWNL